MAAAGDPAKIAPAISSAGSDFIMAPSLVCPEFTWCLRPAAPEPVTRPVMGIYKLSELWRLSYEQLLSTLCCSGGIIRALLIAAELRVTLLRILRYKPNFAA